MHLGSVLKQRHVTDFETYVLILYTALQNLLPARYFIPPVAKIGNLFQVSYFSVLKWGRAKGNLVHLCTSTLVLYVAGFGYATLEQCTWATWGTWATCCRLLSSLCCGVWVRNARTMYSFAELLSSLAKGSRGKVGTKSYNMVFFAL